MSADQVKALAAKVADVRNMAESIPEDGIWSVMREVKRDLAIIEAEARALGEIAGQAAGDE